MNVCITLIEVYTLGTENRLLHFKTSTPSDPYYSSLK
jgi:hypothetical protein